MALHMRANTPPGVSPTLFLVTPESNRRVDDYTGGPANTLTKGFYPAFLSFPRYILNTAAQERARIAGEEGAARGYKEAQEAMLREAAALRSEASALKATRDALNRMDAGLKEAYLAPNDRSNSENVAEARQVSLDRIHTLTEITAATRLSLEEQRLSLLAEAGRERLKQDRERQPMKTDGFDVSGDSAAGVKEVFSKRVLLKIQPPPPSPPRPSMDRNAGGFAVAGDADPLTDGTQSIPHIDGSNFTPGGQNPPLSSTIATQTATPLVTETPAPAPLANPAPMAIDVETEIALAKNEVSAMRNSSVREKIKAFEKYN